MTPVVYFCSVLPFAPKYRDTMVHYPTSDMIGGIARWSRTMSSNPPQRSRTHRSGSLMESSSRLVSHSPSNAPTLSRHSSWLFANATTTYLLTFGWLPDPGHFTYMFYVLVCAIPAVILSLVGVTQIRSKEERMWRYEER